MYFLHVTVDSAYSDRGNDICKDAHVQYGKTDAETSKHENGHYTTMCSWPHCAFQDYFHMVCDCCRSVDQ